MPKVPPPQGFKWARHKSWERCVVCRFPGHTRVLPMLRIPSSSPTNPGELVHASECFDKWKARQTEVQP